MKYELFSSVPNELWARVVTRCPSATFFHTPTWAKILTDTFPQWQIASWGIRFEEGSVVVFPMLKIQIIEGAPFFWFESMVPGVYGGPIFDKQPQADQYSILWKEVVKLGNVSLSASPFSDWEVPGFQSREILTQVLRLESDFDRIYRGFSEGRRHTIKFAKKSGVSLEMSCAERDFEDYFLIYLDQLKRWGKNASDFYPRRLFQNIAAQAKHCKQIKLWLAKKDARIISGLIVFYHNEHLVTWHGATLASYFSYRPVDLLYAAVIEDACKSGYTYFDFNYSGGHEAVVQFKERYGAEKMYYRIYKKVTPLGYIYRLRRRVRLKLGLCPLG